jgi:cyclophilin family peptidyl-prolyl cis-trans isomerase
MSNRNLILTILIIILVGAGVGGFFYWQQTKPLVVSEADILKAMPTQVPEASPTAASSPTPTTSMSITPTPSKCERNFDSNKLSSNANISIKNRTVEMNVAGFGKISLQFYPEDAPKTVENFLRLTDSGYFNCLTFHRVAKGFVIQAGDPNGNGTGGTSAFGSKFADELNPESASFKAGYVKGTLAMANSGPNTNGSQFFIMLADNELPHLYTIFGKVSAGLDVVDKIGKVDISPQMGPSDGAPLTPVVMQTVKIIK